jgi:hypothetical protein
MMCFYVSLLARLTAPYPWGYPRRYRLASTETATEGIEGRVRTHKHTQRETLNSQRKRDTPLSEVGSLLVF